MYNQPLTDLLTFILTTSLGSAAIIGILYGIYFDVKPIKFSENFDLGYVRDDEPSQTFRGAVEEDELEALKREVEIAKLKKQLVELKARQVHVPNSKNKPKDQSDVNPIIKDCIDALVSMGEKKSVARATVKKYFVNNPNTKTVEEFIAGVFK